MKTIQRSVLNRMVEDKSPDMPVSIRVNTRLTLRWAGGAWVRDKVSDNDVHLVEDKVEMVLVKG